MNSRKFVHQVWDAIGSCLAAEGFALGGGLAMRAHGIINRETQDIDVFRRDPLLLHPEAFDSAETQMLSALTGGDLMVEKTYHQDFARRFEVRDSTTRLSTNIDLGRDQFPNPFVHIPGYGTVINRDDMAGMKMRALWERHAERDYVDYDAMICSGIWSISDLIALLARTGSIAPPEQGEWVIGLAEILEQADRDADEMILEDIGVPDPHALFKRLGEYAQWHRKFSEPSTEAESDH